MPDIMFLKYVCGWYLSNLLCRRQRSKKSYVLCNDARVEVEHIAEWLQQKKLSLNTEKTEYMVVGHKRQANHIIRPIEISTNGESI